MTTLEVSAYPLDRSLKGLTEWPDLDAVLTINGFTKGETRDLTAAGENQLPAIVTLARGDVTRPIWSRTKAPSTVTLVVPGGTAGNKVLNAGPELAPDWAHLTEGSPVIVGGAFSDVPDLGTVLEPSFIYALAPNGTVTSLLESGSDDPYPDQAPVQHRAHRGTCGHLVGAVIPPAAARWARGTMRLSPSGS